MSEIWSPEQAAAAGREAAGIDIDAQDLIGRALEFVPPGKVGELIAHIYRCTVNSIVVERNASRLAIPSLTTQAESSRRIRICADTFATMRDPAGMAVSYTRAMAMIPKALFCEIHGLPWKDELVANSDRTFSEDVLSEYGEKMLNS